MNSDYTISVFIDAWIHCIALLRRSSTDLLRRRIYCILPQRKVLESQPIYRSENLHCLSRAHCAMRIVHMSPLITEAYRTRTL